jgi:hypothetical protein
MSDLATYTELRFVSKDDPIKETIIEELDTDCRPIIINLKDFQGDITPIIQEIINTIKTKRVFFHFPYPIFFVVDELGRYNEDLMMFQEKHEAPIFFTLKNKTITKLHQSKIRSMKVLQKIYSLTPFAKIKEFLKEYTSKQSEIHQLINETILINRALGLKNETKKITTHRF